MRISTFLAKAGKSKKNNILRDIADDFIKEHAPSGKLSDFLALSHDSATLISANEKQIVFSVQCQHLTKDGWIESWDDYNIKIYPNLEKQFHVKVSGINTNNVKEYLAETYIQFLDKNIVDITGKDFDFAKEAWIDAKANQKIEYQGNVISFLMKLASEIIKNKNKDAEYNMCLNAMQKFMEIYAPLNIKFENSAENEISFSAIKDKTRYGISVRPEFNDDGFVINVSGNNGEFKNLLKDNFRNFLLQNYVEIANGQKFDFESCEWQPQN